jgi:hypothetical protein
MGKFKFELTYDHTAGVRGGRSKEQSAGLPAIMHSLHLRLRTLCPGKGWAVTVHTRICTNNR